MQIYRGLDISSAKATPSEQAQVPHHMLDICDATTKSFSVFDFRNMALPILDHLRNDYRTPVIVGGTTYYIESLLWQVLIPHVQNKRKSDDGLSDNVNSDDKLLVDKIIAKLSPHQSNHGDPMFLYKLLTGVDPESAQRIHPNDTRKIVAALEVYVDTGKTMSEYYAKQKMLSGSSELGGPLRYDNVIMFWLKCDQTKLDARIDARIDGMIAQGLIYEIRKCHNILRDYLVANNQNPDNLTTTKGMAQAIGFKELLPYLEKYRDELHDTEITEFILSHGGRSGKQIRFARVNRPDGLDLLESCLDDLRLHTKQYSKSQIKWVQNRIVKQKRQCVPPLYVLDTTNAETTWHDDVYTKAEHVVQSFFDGVEPTEVQTIERPKDTTGHRTHVMHFCDVCERYFSGDDQWNVHINSNSHSKVQKSKRREAQLAQRSVFRKFVDRFYHGNSQTDAKQWKRKKAKRALAQPSLFRKCVDTICWLFDSIKNRFWRR